MQEHKEQSHAAQLMALAILALDDLTVLLRAVYRLKKLRGDAWTAGLLRRMAAHLEARVEPRAPARLGEQRARRADALS